MAAARKPTGDADLTSYFRARIESFAKRLLETAEDLHSEESEVRQREFEEHVEKRLQNGGKFIPRKRQSG